MNLNALTVPMMLYLSSGWVSDPIVRSALTDAGPLGLGVLDQLDKAHVPLRDLQNNRTGVRTKLRELIDRTSALDQLRRRKARAVYFGLRASSEAADDDAKVTEHRALLDLLFPIGLSVTRLGYMEARGAAIALECAVTPSVRAQLAAVTIGSVTLDQLFDEWMAAAHELGQTVVRRIALTARSSRDGSDGHACDSKAVRGRWIRAVRGLLWCLDTEPELAAVRESVHAVLNQAIATAQRRGVAVEHELADEPELADADPEDPELEADDPYEPDPNEPDPNDPDPNDADDVDVDPNSNELAHPPNLVT